MTGNRVQRIGRPAICLLVFSLMCSCVIVPTDLPEPRPFRERDLAIRVGETTKEEIEELVSQSRADGLDIRGPSELLGGSWWRYTSNRDLGELFIFLGAQTGVFAGTAPLGDRDYNLLLRFNDSDILAEYAVVTERNPCDNRICYVEGQIIRQADPTTQAAVEPFEAPPGHCGLYVYLDLFPDAASVYLNGEWIGDLFDEESYYYRTVSPGMHRVTADRISPTAGSLETGIVECHGGDLIFVRIGGRGIGYGDMMLGVVNNRSGRQAVLDRYLAVVEPPAATRPRSRLRMITPGVTTKEEIRAELGDSSAFGVRGPYEMDGGQWWAYDFGDAPIDGLRLTDASLERVLRPRFVAQETALLLRFGGNDVLAEYTQSDEYDPCDLDHRICYAEGGRFLRLAEQSTQRAVRRTELPPGQCGLYFYLHDDQASNSSISIHLDSIRVFRNLFSNKIFYYRAVEPGTHVVTTEPPPRSPAISFECTGGELIFVRMLMLTRRIELVNSTIGRQALPFRQLAMDASVEP